VSSINNLVPMTELDAVNAMLAVIGESPIASVDTATQADVLMAIATLRDSARECLALGWKFNTEYGYELKPVDTFSWVDSSGITTLLNIFTPTSDMISATLTRSIAQAKQKIDAVVRPARFYRSKQIGSLTNQIFEEFTNTAAPNIPAETLPSYVDTDGRSLWTQLQMTRASAVQISVPAGTVNYIYSDSSGASTAEFKYTLAPPSGDYSATIRIPAFSVNVADSAAATFFVSIRNTSQVGSEYYRGRLVFANNGTSVDAFLDKINATTFATNSSTTDVSLASGWDFTKSHTVTVQGIGSSVLMFVDGNFVASFTGVANTAAGNPGLGWTVVQADGNKHTYPIDAFSTSYITFANTGLVPLVFYDTYNHRDGFDSGLVPFLYVDAKFTMDFEQMPEEARKYITIRAARQFADRAVQSAEIEGYTHNDELFALRELKRAHGQEDDYNVLDAASQYLYGRRNRQASGFFDARSLPGHS